MIVKMIRKEYYDRLHPCQKCSPEILWIIYP